MADASPTHLCSCGPAVASADKVVRMFSLAHSRKDGEVLLPVAKFVGHTDAVRGLTMLSARAFASCGNDG